MKIGEAIAAAILSIEESHLLYRVSSSKVDLPPGAIVMARVSGGIVLPVAVPISVHSARRRATVIGGGLTRVFPGSDVLRSAAPFTGVNHGELFGSAPARIPENWIVRDHTTGLLVQARSLYNAL
jgi:hypothetical protein